MGEAAIIIGFIGFWVVLAILAFIGWMASS